jgi:hypothetical protein
MSLREAAQQALEALEKVTRELLAVREQLAERGGRPTTNVFHQRLWDSSFDAYTNHAIPVAEALRTALAEPEQEPVAWKDTTYGNLHHQNFGGCIPLYTHPPQRKPLTDEEVIEHFQTQVDTGSLLSFVDGVRYAERAHGIGGEA